MDRRAATRTEPTRNPAGQRDDLTRPTTSRASITDLTSRGQQMQALRSLADSGPAAVAQRRRFEGLFSSAAPATGPVQRMTQDSAATTWANDAVIDPATTLVIRGGGMPNTINAGMVESRNPDNKKKKATDPWPSGTFTGISVVAATTHVGDKTPYVVFRAPVGLGVRQCSNDHHAEFRTTAPHSSKQLNDLIKQVKFTGVEDGTVAQL